MKLKANGAVSARDWCMLKALAKVKGPGQGGNGNGGNGNGDNGNGDGNSGAEDPFNTGIFQFTGWGDQSPRDTLYALQGAEEHFAIYLAGTEYHVQKSIWYSSGPAVQEAFITNLTPLVEEVRVAHTQLKAAINAGDEQKVWKEVLPVWSKARLFMRAQFTSWAEPVTGGDFGVLIRDEVLAGGSATAAQTSLSNFRATRDAYAARVDADTELVEMTDSYLAWAEANLPETLKGMENLLVRWVEASSTGDKEWFQVLKDMRQLEDDTAGPAGLSNIVWVALSRFWFTTLSEGGDPRDDDLPIPGDQYAPLQLMPTVLSLGSLVSPLLGVCAKLSHIFEPSH